MAGGIDDSNARELDHLTEVRDLERPFKARGVQLVREVVRVLAPDQELK